MLLDINETIGSALWWVVIGIISFIVFLFRKLVYLSIHINKLKLDKKHTNSVDDKDLDEEIKKYEKIRKEHRLFILGVIIILFISIIL